MLESYLKTAEGKSVLMDWLTTVDHKKIGVMYIFAAVFFFLLAGIEAILIRIQLIVPNNDFLSASTYNEMITMHGTTMMFFAALPILFGLMNFIVPLQIGARDVAFPFLNALGFWLFFFGGVLLNISWFFGALPDAGWTAYSSLALDSAGVGVDYYLLSVQISGFGTIISAINFLVTIVNMRVPGMMENDPWDGRTLEWAISSPPPEYNFVQVPLVKSLDAFFTQKYGGKDEGFVDAEPAGMIHMPNPSILPLFIAIGLFIAGLAIIYHQFVIAAIGILITLLSMLTRSVKDELSHRGKAKGCNTANRKDLRNCFCYSEFRI
ncbi:hypothetical protein UB32_01295 [Mesobacillus subterraneus]|uniref:Cytochrome oxidase subunit I profile domain-containing protein n=1 Tax=Mesobacillus subterraneus TaxID=285983 RepID=A0A0D6ZE25_9BACI|nr:cbb3-type cytochrome c oxidase subunit I [Mesobacillus subterraneus]KIY23772.1 hypothetical protein UB32_01295 [Mesobacillus subterraneus]